MRILVVEDERYLAEALADILRKNHYTADTVFDGEDGLDYAESGIYDIIILDIMLPKINGIEVLRRMRAEKIKTPVILLTAKSEVSDKVLGLDSGADDYLAKPFDTEELLARVRALGRRREDIVLDNTLSCGDTVLNTSTLKLSRETKEVALTQKEFALLEFLIANRGRIVSKGQIIEKLWGFDSDAEDNHVEVYISFLRKKLLFLSSSITIQTVRGMGYRLEEA